VLPQVSEAILGSETGVKQDLERTAASMFASETDTLALILATSCDEHATGSDMAFLWFSKFYVPGQPLRELHFPRETDFDILKRSKT